MKSKNQPSDKLFAGLFFLCLVGVEFLLAPTPIAAQANLRKAIDRYIEKVREDADEYDGQIVSVSEYAPDGSLDEWLKTHGKMPVEKAVEMTVKILDGLEFLHSRNIIHRDLKPANILLQGNTPRLADFGISRALRTTDSSQSSNVSGTFAYMPPEGFDGKRSVQTDVWSVGVNLYQFLTGSLPFPQKEPSALIAAIMMREFEPLPADVPQSLKNVIAKALAKEPTNRYASASEMRGDLRRVLRGEAVSDFIQSDSRQNFSSSEIPPTQKVAPNFAQSFQDENETVVRSAPSFGQSEKHKISNVWMYATLALVLVGAVGLGVYFFANQSKQNNLNKSEVAQVSATQPSNNSANSENSNTPTVSNVSVETPTPIPTPDKGQVQRMIRQYISNKGGGDVSQGVKIDYGDLDNDGDEDAATKYTVFQENGNFTVVLAVFRNNNGIFSFADKVFVGGSGDYVRYINIIGIKGGKIYAVTATDEEGKEERKNTQYSLKGNKLIER